MPRECARLGAAGPDLNNLHCWVARVVTGSDRWHHPDLAPERERLAARLTAALERTGDPRSEGEAPWERYPVYAGYLKDHEAFLRSRADTDD